MIPDLNVGDLVYHKVELILLKKLNIGIILKKRPKRHSYLVYWINYRPNFYYTSDFNLAKYNEETYAILNNR